MYNETRYGTGNSLCTPGASIALSKIGSNRCAGPAPQRIREFSKAESRKTLQFQRFSAVRCGQLQLAAVISLVI